jgi:hypothetical protein
VLDGSWPAELLSDARASVRAMLLATESALDTLEPLLDSVWLRRLGRVSFLGTLDAQPDAQGRTTRLEHSVAVAEAALRLGLSAGLSGRALTTFVLAGLLHDAGHFPLSHSAEAALSRVLGGDHHDLTRWIVLGEGPVPAAGSLRPAIEGLGCDPRHVWAIVAGEPQSVLPPALAACFSGQLNLDTLEAIPRVARTFGLTHDAPGTDLLEVKAGQLVVPPIAVARADRFWRLKDEVYVAIVNRSSNILFEDAVSAAASSLKPASLGPLESLDDAALLGALDRVELDLTELERTFEVVPDPDGRRVRKRYRIDHSIAPGPLGLPASEWSRRYVHYRERVRVIPKTQGRP